MFGRAIDRGLAAWMSSAVAGGPIARSVDCWNQLQTVLPALKSAILKEIN